MTIFFVSKHTFLSIPKLKWTTNEKQTKHVKESMHHTEQSKKSQATSHNLPKETAAQQSYSCHSNPSGSLI